MYLVRTLPFRPVDVDAVDVVDSGRVAGGGGRPPTVAPAVGRLHLHLVGRAGLQAGDLGSGIGHVLRAVLPVPAAILPVAQVVRVDHRIRRLDPSHVQGAGAAVQRLDPGGRRGRRSGPRQAAVHLVLALCSLRGIGEVGGDVIVNALDRAAVELQLVRLDVDAVAVHVGRLDHVGEPQRRGPRTAVVVRPPEVRRVSAADAQPDVRRAGHPHRLVEGHRDLDGLVPAVGGDLRNRRRGDHHREDGGCLVHVGHRHGDGLVGRQRAVARSPGGGDGHHVGVVPTGVGGVFVVGRVLERQNAAGRVDVELRLVRAAGDGVAHRVSGVLIRGPHRADVRLVLGRRERRGAGELRRGVGRNGDA